MRSLLFIVLLNLVVSVASAQRASGYAQQGQQFFAAQQFAKARGWYAAAVAQDTTALSNVFMLAESLRHLYRYAEALPLYRRLSTEAPRQFPAAELYYALMLQRQGRCPDALPVLDRLIAREAVPDTLVRRAQRIRQGCYGRAIAPPDTSLVALQRLPAPVNTSAQDYAAIPYRNDSSLVLTSGRRGTSGRQIDHRFGESFTDLFVLEQAEGRWKLRSRTAAPWNASAQDAAGGFDASYERFYFTRCEKDYCRIYVSARRGKRWQRPTRLPETINALGTNAKHPTLSAGGDTLFFVSDRAGGFGGTDLWMSRRDSTDHWSVARNLGADINTAGHEVSPFYYAAEDLLFFASNGYGGRSDMDLYAIRWETDSSPLVPYPLLPPFNSPQDDAFFSVGVRRGYLSTNRDGCFDIYSFAPDTAQSLLGQLLGYDESISERRVGAVDSGLVLSYPAIRAEPFDITVVRSIGEEQLANGSGRFILNSDVSDIALRRLREAQTNRSDASDSFRAAEAEPTALSYRPSRAVLAQVQTNTIPPDRRGEVAGTVYRAADGQPLPRAEVHLIDSSGVVAKITTTNEIGHFHFVNLRPGTQYKIALGRSPADTVYSVRDLRLEEYGKEISTLPFETLYFNFNEATLRPEARQALKDLTLSFRQNPPMTIEINAYTDSLGNDAYNMLLSQQRGESVYNFLRAQGIDPSALVINAQGASTAMVASNSRVSQQLNRRVEIQLIGKDINYYPKAETRILRPNVTLEQLYRTGNIPPGELSLLNGRDPVQVVPFKPLRVPVLESPGLDQFFFSVDYLN